MNFNYSKVFVAVTAAVVFAGVSVQASQTDDRIVSSAQTTYVFKTYLKDDSIRISSNEGIVTLTGSVNDYSHKSLAKETVSSLPGVKSVDDQLVFKGDQPEHNSDNWLSMQVKGALLFNRNVSAVNTQVYVDNGIVTLKGEAQTQAQKDLTGEYAKDVEGIKGVKNEMTLAMVPKKDDQTISEKIDDASISAQVKMAFLSHHSTSAFKTGVSTTDGVVTLTGETSTGAGKDMATKVANDVNEIGRAHV